MLLCLCSDIISNHILSLDNVRHVCINDRDAHIIVIALHYWDLSFPDKTSW